MLFTLFAFLLALGILVTVHEWGHYRVALACGVKVLQFSLGFGPTLLRWQPKKQKNGQKTVFTLNAIPLGGFVRMLDKRDPTQLPIPVQDMAREFNSQAAWKRFLIVAAGPSANLVLAVLLYACLSWIGIWQPPPVLGSPPPHSIAAQAGLHGGERVAQMALLQGHAQVASWQPARSLEDVRWLATQAALTQRDIALQLQNGTRITLPLSRLPVGGELNQAFLDQIGIGRPYFPAVIDTALPLGPAAQAGLQAGDRVLAIDGHDIVDGFDLLQTIQAPSLTGSIQHWEVLRHGQTLTLSVSPRIIHWSAEHPSADGQTTGQGGQVDIRLRPPAAADFIQVRLGPLEGLHYGISRTWEYAALSFQMLARMATGRASPKNLSGTLTIADLAGRSAHHGVLSFLGFLAVISVSLGVVNLLPIPLPALDGGYLVHYAVEILTGKTVSEAVFQKLQQLGIALILCLMLVAHWNDLHRFFPQWVPDLFPPASSSAPSSAQASALSLHAPAMPAQKPIK